LEHLGTKELETKRLILRRFVMNDAECMFNNWANDREVTKYLTWKPHENIDVAKNLLENWIQNYSKNDFYQWAIVLKEINEPIGTIGASCHDWIKMVDFGYCIGKKWWHKGNTSEALNTLIKFFFEDVGVNRIEAKYHPENQNSGKVMTKCGMKYEGLMRQAFLYSCGLYDTIQYGIIADDYFKK
jgi:ribosomal-protein-alanine N-acetyltransferase